ncbi:MAG: 16S rRNA (adenine(1518)-N(6)/adenine(1519)-N(6))-dimethyltransferase RsmA [Pseudomonadota bacterium]
MTPRHTPRKRFGQHFLHEQGVIDRIVAAVEPRANEAVLEIGPGEGALTERLLASGVHVTAVEVDRDLARQLRERFGGWPFHLVEADVLRLSLVDLAEQGQPFRVVANLPYNISTPVMFQLLDSISVITDLHLMVQKEVAERLSAGPGIRQYGRLGVMAAVHGQVQRLFDVAPGAFRPPPKVTSSVIRITPHADPLVGPALMPAFSALVKRCFSQRRKTLRRILSGTVGTDQLQALGLDPSARPETLSVKQFRDLSQALHRAAGVTHSCCG